MNRETELKRKKEELQKLQRRQKDLDVEIECVKKRITSLIREIPLP